MCFIFSPLFVYQFVCSILGVIYILHNVKSS
jgi:hypothetical protein